MVDSELQPRSELDLRIKETVERGEAYARAFLVLDPRLANVSSGDLAVGFDVGSGADAVAFKALGFRRALITNSTSSLYQFSFSRSVASEEAVLAAIEKRMPERTRVSSLAVSDVLGPDFSPRLTTMLRIAPGYFGSDDPAEILRMVTGLRDGAQPNKTTVVSALDDHEQSGEAFRTVHAELISRGIEHIFYMDEGIPDTLQVLGQRILAIAR